MTLWTRWWCILFHKKVVKELRIPGHIFTIQMGKYEGCVKCDLWRRVDE